MPGPGLPVIAAGVGIAIKGFGKALKAYKRANRRKRLGLPKKTFMERQKSAKKVGKAMADSGRVRGYKIGRK